MSESVKRTNPLLVKNIAHDGYRNDDNRMGKGKMPTSFSLYYAGKFRRIYAMVYGNSPSLYIIHNGEDLFLDVDTKIALGKVPRTIMHADIKIVDGNIRIL